MCYWYRQSKRDLAGKVQQELSNFPAAWGGGGGLLTGPYSLFLLHH